MSDFFFIFDKISEDYHWKKKLLIGAVLSFIPIVNFFALGYLSEYARQILKDKDNLSLPEWERPVTLFISGFWFFLIILVYGGGILFIAFLIGLFISILSFGLLSWLAFFPITIAALLAPSLVILGLINLHLIKSTKEIFKGLAQHFNVILSSWKYLLIPNLAFLGVVTIGAPVYGISYFLGFIILIPYTISVFINAAKNLKQ